MFALRKSSYFGGVNNYGINFIRTLMFIYIKYILFVAVVMLDVVFCHFVLDRVKIRYITVQAVEPLWGSTTECKQETNGHARDWPVETNR